MGFKDKFVGLLNSAMSKEVPVSDEDFDEDYSLDFGDDTEMSVDGDDTELTYTSLRSGRRSTFKRYNVVENSDTEYGFDDDDDSVMSSRLDELYGSASSDTEEGGTTFISSHESSTYTRGERYSRMSAYDRPAEVTNERKGDRKVVSMNNNSNLKVFLANPTEYSDCQDICSRVRSQMTVVVNLEKVKSAEEKRRIFDFISGCSYALDCNFERISDSIYIVAPCHVDIFEEIAEGNQESSRRGATSFSAILN